jgi:hypothetical protein
VRRVKGEKRFTTKRCIEPVEADEEIKNSSQSGLKTQKTNFMKSISVYGDLTFFLFKRGAFFMNKTIKCSIDENHRVHSLENIELPAGKNALITFLDQDDLIGVNETAFLIEASLGKDWNKAEEDSALSSFQ